MPAIKTVDEKYKISDKRGNGTLRREVWVDERGRVVKYNLAYINHHLFAGDHGRVVGYDNAHDGHHKHHLGQVIPIEFEGFAQVEAMFEADWIAISRGEGNEQN